MLVALTGNVSAGRKPRLRGGSMSEEVNNRQESSASRTPANASAGFWLDRIARAFARTDVPFEMSFPDGALRRFGQGAPSFSVRLNNRNAVRAITSLDQVKFADAYLAGDIDIDGDMLRPFELRQTMGDRHPLMTVWRFLQPLLLGQVRTNQAAITSHYDVDAEFFLSFLDPKTPCYTQGVYLSAAETLDVATTRKFDYCYEKLQLQPGDHILEVGPGWGAWFDTPPSRNQMYRDQHLPELDRLSEASVKRTRV